MAAPGTEKALLLLTEISRQLRRHQGEFVLMLQRTVSESDGPGGCFAPDKYYHRHVVRTLGVIEPLPDDWLLTTSTRELPTSRYYTEGRHGRGEEVSPGTWTYRYLVGGRHGLSGGFATELIFGLEDEPNWRGVTHGEQYAGEKSLEIIIGDEAVGRFFTWHERRIDDLIWPEKSRLWYQQAAEALGRPLAETPELDAHRMKEREQLLEQLWRINDEAALYRRELDALHRARHGSGLYSRGGAVGFILDDDDLRIHSMGPSGKLNDVIRRLKALLEKAHQLGLADHPYVTAFSLRYGVSVIRAETSQPA